jgi:hypothetical protein
VHASHTLFAVFPNFPDGQLFEHVEAVKKFGETQAVHVDAAPEHVLRGELQALHRLSLESPHCSSGQLERHVLLVRKRGLVQDMQVVAAP